MTPVDVSQPGTDQLSPAQEIKSAQLHHDALIIDGTALIYTLESRFARSLIAAGVSAALVTVFVGVETGQGNHTGLAMRAIDGALRRIERPDSELQLVNTVDDIHRARDAHKLGVILAFQNATPFADSLDLVRVFHGLGIRCVQLTYNQRNLAADGCLEPKGGGLSLFGVELLHAMQEIGIAVDLSHVGDASVEHAIEVAHKPLAFTHANARVLCDNPRNKLDRHIVDLTGKGGVIGLNAFPAFLRNDGSRPSIDDLLDQADYLLKLAGPKAVSLGLDFIEGWGEKEKVNLRAHADAFGTSYDFPTGLDGVAQLPNLTRGLVSRGHDDEVVKGILGNNLLAFLTRAWV